MTNFIGFRKLGAKMAKGAMKDLEKKSVATLKKDLQKVFNTYIRLRDTLHDKGTPYFICISCRQPKGLDQMHAGHFWPVGGNEAVRFDEDNTHGQCEHCNTFKHGNLVQYTPNLIKKIGMVRFEKLSHRRLNRSKMMAFELELLIQTYKEKITKLKGL
jgi:hypothetical protein